MKAQISHLLMNEMDMSKLVVSKALTRTSDQYSSGVKQARCKYSAQDEADGHGQKLQGFALHPLSSTREREGGGRVEAKVMAVLQRAAAELESACVGLVDEVPRGPGVASADRRPAGARNDAQRHAGEGHGENVGGVRVAWACSQEVFGAADDCGLLHELPSP